MRVGKGKGSKVDVSIVKQFMDVYKVQGKALPINILHGSQSCYTVEEGKDKEGNIIQVKKLRLVNGTLEGGHFKLRSLFSAAKLTEAQVTELLS